MITYCSRTEHYQILKELQLRGDSDRQSTVGCNCFSYNMAEPLYVLVPQGIWHLLVTLGGRVSPVETAGPGFETSRKILYFLRRVESRITTDLVLMFKVNPYSIALELENIIVSLNTFSLTSDGPPNLLMLVRYSYFPFCMSESGPVQAS